jgi:hypothetical protein
MSRAAMSAELAVDGPTMTFMYAKQLLGEHGSLDGDRTQT